jgi:hypothetical protein
MNFLGDSENSFVLLKTGQNYSLAPVQGALNIVEIIRNEGEIYPHGLEGF